jgi:hypothetical protein
MTRNTALVVAALLWAVPAHATIYFQNSGSTSGWGELKLEHNASITAVPNCYKGTTGLKFQTTYDANYGGRYHTEARIKNGLAALNIERYYGWAAWYSTSWQSVAQNFNMQQFIGNWTADDSTCTSGASPTTMTWLNNTTLHTRVKWGTLCHQTTAGYTFTTSFAKGVWHRVVMRGRWKNDNTGIFEGWLDGSKRFSRVNAPTWMAGTNTGMNLAIGMYANSWHDAGEMLGTQPTRTWYIDSVRVASSLAEADPLNW